MHVASLGRSENGTLVMQSRDRVSNVRSMVTKSDPTVSGAPSASRFAIQPDTGSRSSMSSTAQRLVAGAPRQWSTFRGALPVVTADRAPDGSGTGLLLSGNFSCDGQLEQGRSTVPHESGGPPRTERRKVGKDVAIVGTRAR